MIGESELILHPRGSIYHLDMLPENLADLIFTVGDPNRVSEVSKHFDFIENSNAHREFVWTTGYIGNKKITVLSTGIGPDNIDIVLNELDALANIDFKTREIKSQLRKLQIIRLGTSGSIQSHIPVDSFVLSSHAIGMDNMLQYYQMEFSKNEIKIAEEFCKQLNLEQSNIHPYCIEANGDLISKFNSEFHRGITVTAPGFYAPQGRVLRGELKFPNLVDSLSNFKSEQQIITNFEMETSAIYGLSKLFNHDCLSVSAIVANRPTKTFSTQSSQTINKMIEMTLQNILS